MPAARPCRSACSATAPRCSPSWSGAGWRPDVVTDQTSAHDPLGGYVPAGLSLEEAAALRASDPDDYMRRAYASMADARRGDGRLPGGGRGRVRLREQPARGRRARRARARPRVRVSRGSCRRSSGRCSARARDRSGGRRCRATRRTSPQTDRAVAELFPDDERLQRWLGWPRSGSRSRACRRGSAGSATASARRPGSRFNELVAHRASCRAPIVIGRDHLDSGSVASPYRETEAMLDGSDAIADWPILNALINTAAGAHWVSVHHGGGVGIGYSIHAGMVVVADGTDDARDRLRAGADDRPGHGRRSATPTPATTARWRSPRSAASGSRCARRDRAAHRRHGRR